MLLWESFLLAFTALLPLINPLGSALVFLGLVGHASPETIRKLARSIAINTVVFLTVIELLGTAILGFFGISLPIVQLAGGVVLAAIGWSVLNEKDETAAATSEAKGAAVRDETELLSLEERAFYPFTFPITAGPGVLVVVLTLTAHASEQTLTGKLLSHAGVLLAVVVLSALVYVCYANAPRLTKAISPSTVHGILRIVAFILVCIGVQIAWNGLSVLLGTLLKR